MYIYLYTNKINGKQYVGQTRNPVEKRHAAHIRDALVKESRYYFHNALRSEGVENFNMEVIDTATSLQELNSKETYWILKLKTLRPDGYNLNTGGNSCQPCDETRQKLKIASTGERNAMYGKYGEANPFFGHKHTPEAIEKTRQAAIGRPSPRKGKPHTEAAKQKISEARKRRTGFHHTEATKQKMRLAALHRSLS
jgi:group I intron endonuclease